jgi:hypothetical protein
MRSTTFRWITAMALVSALATPVWLTAQEDAATQEQKSVKMTFSGNGAASPTNLNQPDTSNAEENLAGNGPLGSFTFRDVRATPNSPSSQPPSTCSGPTQLYFPSIPGAGAGIFRFQDGSLLTVKLTQGGDCINFAPVLEAQCTLSLQIISGTGRFKNASGILTLTETSLPVLADASGNPVFFTETGQFTGTVSGVAMGESRQDERQ